MKNQKIGVVIAVLLLIVATMQLTAGVALASPPMVVKYDMPTNLPSKYISTDFEITANNQDIDIYKSGNNAWGNAVSYASFDFSGTISVTVNVNFNFSTARILPRAAGIPCTINGSQITFSLSEAQDITILLDEDFHGRTLHIFAKDIESNIPSANDPNVIYFAPGYYDYSQQTPMLIGAGKTLYIAGGAVIRGRILIKDASNVTVRGRGLILNDYLKNDSFDDVALVLKGSSNVTIEDVLISRDINSWSAFMYKCSNVTVKDTKILNTYYACSDGFDIANSHDVLYDNVFIRSCDDAIAIKGTGTDGYVYTEDPALGLPNYNITINNSQIWSDTNNALEIGAETVASYYNNIKFNNIDILYSYDDLTYPDMLNERSAINICILNATNISDIFFENIRVEEAKRLISINMCDSYWFNSILGNWTWDGNVFDITYKNITSHSSGSNEIRIYGKDSTHTISNVTFENIIINDQKLLNFADSRFNVNSFVTGLSIKDNNAVVAYANGAFGENTYSAVGDYASIQGNEGWNYRVWTSGVGIQDMTWDSGQSWWRGWHNYDLLWMNNGYIFIHPDNDQTLLEWKAQRDGDINIVGTVKKYDVGGGDGVMVSIWKNNTQIWPQNGNWHAIPYNDNVGITHDVHTTISTNDIISFRVDEGSTNFYDTTVWDPVVVYE